MIVGQSQPLKSGIKKIRLIKASLVIEINADSSKTRGMLIKPFHKNNYLSGWLLLS